MQINKPTNLILWFILFQSIGFLTGLLTQANIYPWYTHLLKSSLTPPGIIFSIVWGVLYGLLAIVAWILTIKSSIFSKKIIVLFTLQMLMNWMWTPLFFGFHWLKVSAIWLIILSSLNIILIRKCSNKNTIITWLLIPYLLWLLFASYLNIFIALNN